jgi:sarcosine oxidase, subunit beta
VSQPSVAVIGAGVAGLSAALRAAELGCEVTVVEREHPASGSSGLSAGIFNINSTEPLQVEVRVRTRALLDRFEAENGLPLARIGYLRLARNEAHVKLFEEVIALQRELGVEPSRIVDLERVREIVPDLRTDDLVAAIHNPRDGHMDGPLLCGVLAERAEAEGARILHRTRVVGYQRGGGGRRHRLLTDGDPVEADVVVNAAGPWAMEIGELLGHPFPLVNQLHEVIKVSLPPEVDYTVPMVQEYIPGEEEAGYFRQDGPHSLIGGMHTYERLDRLGSADPETYRRSVAWDTWEAVAQHVSNRLMVDGLGFETGWTGLYPISADGEYVVGPYGADETVIACGGFGGQGLTAGVSVGALAAEWAVHGEPRGLPGATAWLPDRPGLQEG